MKAEDVINDLVQKETFLIDNGFIKDDSLSKLRGNPIYKRASTELNIVSNKTRSASLDSKGNRPSMSTDSIQNVGPHYIGLETYGFSYWKPGNIPGSKRSNCSFYDYDKLAKLVKKIS